MAETRGRLRNAVLLIDIENLIGGGRDPKPVDIVEFVRAVKQHYAPFVSEFAIARAYANWTESYLRKVRDALHIADIDPVQIFRFWGRVENAADAEMIVDAISIAYERPELDVFVLATADGAFAPVVTKLHELGRTVVGVHSSAAALSEHLLEVCDQFALFDLDRSVIRPTLAKGDRAESPDSPAALTLAIVEVVAELAGSQATAAWPRSVHLPTLSKMLADRYKISWREIAIAAGVVDAAGTARRLSAVLKDCYGDDAVAENTLVLHEPERPAPDTSLG